MAPLLPHCYIRPNERRLKFLTGYRRGLAPPGRDQSRRGTPPIWAGRRTVYSKVYTMRKSMQEATVPAKSGRLTSGGLPSVSSGCLGVWVGEKQSGYSKSGMGSFKATIIPWVRGCALQGRSHPAILKPPSSSDRSASSEFVQAGRGRTYCSIAKVTGSCQRSTARPASSFRPKPQRFNNTGGQNESRSFLARAASHRKRMGLQHHRSKGSSIGRIQVQQSR